VKSNFRPEEKRNMDGRKVDLAPASVKTRSLGPSADICIVPKEGAGAGERK